MCVACLTWCKPGGETMFDDTWAALASVTAHVTETAARSPPLDFVLRDLEVIGQRRGSSGCVQVYRPKISRGSRDRATVVVKRPRKSTEYYVDNAFALLAEVAVHRAIASRLHGSWAENLFAKMLGCERTRMTRSAKPPEYHVAYEAMDGGRQAHGETVRTFLTEPADKGGYRSDEEVGLVLVQLACVVRLLAEDFGVLHGDLSAVNMYVQRGGEREDALVLRLIDCGWSQMAVDRESNSSSWMAGVAAHVNEATGVGWLGSHQLAYAARKQWQSDGGKMGVQLKTKRTLRALGRMLLGGRREDPGFLVAVIGPEGADTDALAAEMRTELNAPFRTSSVASLTSPVPPFQGGADPAVGAAPSLWRAFRNFRLFQRAYREAVEPALRNGGAVVVNGWVDEWALEPERFGLKRGAASTRWFTSRVRRPDVTLVCSPKSTALMRRRPGLSRREALALTAAYEAYAAREATAFAVPCEDGEEPAVGLAMAATLAGLEALTPGAALLRLSGRDQAASQPA